MKNKSWRAVAGDLAEAIARCDWSYGRVQEVYVHRRLDEAMAAFREKDEPKRKKRARSCRK